MNPKKIIETRKYKRLYGFIIDLIVILLFMEVTARLEDISVLETPMRILRVTIGFGGYHIPMEYFLGKTVGKIILRTRVVNSLGEKINLREALIRFVSRFIPFEIFSIALGIDARAWHDILSKTYVIDDPQK
ncbi:MAG: RDD family protein [Roseivirga sp.]|nr:RDD family protein [Roseivirga sp.]